MSGSVALIVLVLGIVLAVVVGNRAKVNIGVLCLGLAYVVGCFVMGSSVMSVVSLFPVKIFFLIFSVTFFFGFHTHNGTFDVLASKMLYSCRNHTWALPIMLAVTTAVVSALGAGSTGSAVIVGPVAYLIAAQAGFDPLLMAIIVCDFGMIGAIAPWSTIGAMLRGVATGIYGDEIAERIGWNHWLALMLVCVIVFILAYLIFRGFKNRPVQMDRPKEFNAEQKRSLTIICIFLVLVIVPMLCNSVFGGPFFKWLSRYMDVQMLAIVGAIVCSFLKMGDEREILTRQVPWGLILLSGGIATFISVCSGAGAIQVISQWMTDTLPAWIVTPLLSAIGALISFVSDTINVGMNTFGATFPVLAETTGISMFALVEAFLLGGSFTAISPFSMGGSLALSLQPDESRRGRQFTGQILVAIGQALVVVVLAALGFFNLFA